MTSRQKDTVETLKCELADLQEKYNKLEMQLSMSNSAFLNIVGKSLDGIVIVDPDMMVVYTNYAAIDLFDRNIADLLGEPLALDLSPDDLFSSGEALKEINIPKADGSTVIAEVTVLKTEWNNAPSAVVSFRDITERKKEEKVLEYMSHHDFLTDLPNRIYFEKRMSKAIEYAQDNEEHMALLYLDLDDFKTVNDSLGHDIGDALLKEVSAVLQSSIRKGDTVARLGGDEFAIILHGLRKKEYASSIAQNIITKLSHPFMLSDKEIYANVSVGVAVYPEAGTNAVDLIKHADTAMYAAKRNGKNQYFHFCDELNQENERNLIIMNGLREVMEEDQLFLEYQPIINLKTDQCCGIEALLRWQHPELGRVPPDHFLPRAEEMGMMPTIGRWVVERALRDYNALGPDILSLLISINLSANELDGAKVSDAILTSVKQLDLKTDKIILELTETSMMKRPDVSIENFNRLSDIGVKIAIDDYGTGYSSLSYMKRLPISILKIDKSFIDDIGADSNDTAIVRSTIQLAHSLGFDVIAEGVETEEQLAFLKKHDCDYVQGFLLSKPLGFNVLKEYLPKISH